MLNRCSHKFSFWPVFYEICLVTANRRYYFKVSLFSAYIYLLPLWFAFFSAKYVDFFSDRELFAKEKYKLYITQVVLSTDLLFTIYFEAD